MRAKIPDIHSFKFLENISGQFFYDSWDSIVLFDSSTPTTACDTMLENILVEDTSYLKKLIAVNKDFGVTANFPSLFVADLNLCLFQYYLRLYELEKILQWFN
jgi:hypothetical protein